MLEDDNPAHCVVASCCTTRHRKTHSTDARELLYPWHPWASQRVFVHRTVHKRAEAMFHCSPESTSARQLLQIPQWMFDSAAMCGIGLASSPIVDTASLQELKILLSATIDDDVLQVQQPSTDHAGENNAEITEATVAVTADAVSSCRQNARLEHTTSRGSSSSAVAARSPVAGSGAPGLRRRPSRRA